MSRFEGAITTPPEPTDSSAPPAPVRPSRPLLIEVSAAILIVGGITSLVGSLPGALSPDAETAGALPIVALILALNVLTIIVGLLIRTGRGWILALNVVAIELFLYLTALPSAIAALFVALDLVVLFALLRHRWWFDLLAEERRDAEFVTRGNR